MPPALEGGRPVPSTNRRSERGADALVMLMLFVWLWYSLTGFRAPTAPIVLSNEDAGSAMRQLIFLATAAVSTRRLILARSVSQTVGHHWTEYGLLVLLMGSAAWSMLPALTLKRSIVFACGLISLGTVATTAKNPWRTLRLLMFAYGSVGAIASLGAWFALPRNCTENPARPGLAGVASHPNTLAPILVVGFLLSLGLSKSEVRTGVVRVCQGALLFAILLAQSMTSIVFALVGVAIYMYLAGPTNRRSVVHLVGVPLAVAVIGIGPGTVKAEVLGAMGRDASLSGRDELWAAVYAEASKSPVVGSGFGAFWTEGKGRELVTTWNPRQSHMAYLDVFTDLGVIGLVIVVLAFPIRLAQRWPRITRDGDPDARRAAASLYAVAFGVAGSYATAQSFYFKMDSVPFFALMVVMVLTARRERDLASLP